MLVLIVPLLFLGNDALSERGGFHGQPQDSRIAAQEVKRVSDLCSGNESKQQFFDVDYRRAGYLSYFLNDPLIASVAKVEVEKSYCSRESPDLSQQAIAPYDLVIVSFPHLIKSEYLADFAGFINGKGALLLVQPSFETPDQAAVLLRPLGTTYLGTETETFPSSVITGHPANRILGLSEGKSVYPHRMFRPHGKFTVDVEKGAILTRLSLGGEPDLFITANPRVAIVATDIMDDVRTAGPDLPESEKNFRYLFINTVKGLLGLGMMDQPVQEPMQRFAELFYSYACARDYVLAAQKESPFSARLSSAELNTMIDQADSGIRQAARPWCRGDSSKPEACWTAASRFSPIAWTG